MSSYSHQSFYSSGNAADAAFQQADINRNGRIDLGEFRNFLGQNLGSRADVNTDYGASSWKSASYGAGLGAGAGHGLGRGLGGGYNASYVVGDGLAGGLIGSATSYGTVSGGAGFAGGTAFDSSAVAATQVHYATDAQGLFQDPNPQIIHRPASSDAQTYIQNIGVRFLQPPPVPPPGPLIIREVRPPQPPPPPPLRIRQQAPPFPPPPPLVLRERPPQPPPVIASQTVIRRLPALPIPPRSVIIERLPPAPPRPRDIIIERWLPYGPQARRRIIVQRAAPIQPYPAPRNIIIQYETAPVRIVRQFHRVDVVQANPAVYIQRYGASLLDAASLVAQARAAGVVEDISPSDYVGYSATRYSQESFGASSGLAGGAGLIAGGADLVTGGAEVVDAGLALGGGLSSLSFESSSFSSGVGSGADAAFLVADTNLNSQNTGGAGDASYESYSSSYSY